MPDRFVHKDFLVEIIGIHPHSGELGHPVGETPKPITCVMDMWEIELIDCQHGTRGCFAAHKNMRLLKKSSRVLKQD